jgi:ankyrin repeat protein
LLESGADPNAVSSSKRTPLFDVLLKGESTQPTELPEPITNLLVEKLLKAGADPDWLDDLGSVPLHTALNYQRVGAVKLLLKAGVDINRINPQGTVRDYIRIDIARIKRQVDEIPKTPVTDEEMAERRKKYRATLEDKLRRCREIEKILRKFGAKRKSDLSRAKRRKKPEPK